MTEAINVRILDRDYSIGCSPEERDALQAAANLLDARMREIRGSNRMAALDRIAVLAALNLAHELQSLKKTSETRDTDISRSLSELNRKLDGLLEVAHDERAGQPRYDDRLL